MDEHHRLFNRAGPLRVVDKGRIIVEAEPHAGDDDDIDVGLVRDPHQKLVVRLASDREDRDLLRLDQAVEDVDHRNIGPDELARDDPSRRVERRLADIDGVADDFGPIVDWNSGAVEPPSEKRFAEDRLDLAVQKSDVVASRNPPGILEDLESDEVVVKAEDRSVGAGPISLLDAGYLSESNPLGHNRDQISSHIDDSIVYFSHFFFALIFSTTAPIASK